MPTLCYNKSNSYERGVILNENLVSFFEVVKNGTYGFESIFAFLSDLFNSALTHEHVVSVNSWFSGILAPVLDYVAYAFIAIWAIVWLFGKHLLNVIRFFAFFLAGFLLGIYYFSTPVINHFPAIPGWVVGVCVGLALAVLGKILYYAVYSVVAGYGTYLLCVSGTLLPEIKGNCMVALIVAVIALIFLLVIHNFVERFGTAYLGAYFMIYIVVRTFYDFVTPVANALSFIPDGFEWTVLLVAALILALPGYAVQHKMRKRKY